MNMMYALQMAICLCSALKEKKKKGSWTKKIYITDVDFNVEYPLLLVKLLIPNHLLHVLCISKDYKNIEYAVIGKY